ncbi:MAG: hypothetical protein AAGA33_12855 [Pseudomonadota bacterium]
MIRSLDLETVPAAGEGIVVARVINATSYPAPLNQLTIAPENLNASEEIKYQRLSSAAPKFNGTTVFAAPVAAGRYTLTSLRAYHSNDVYRYDHFVPGGTDLGTFDVRPGEVTDLGQLVYYLRTDGDTFYKEIIRIPDEPGDVLKKHFRFYEFNTNTIRGWEDDGREDEFNTFFASAAQNPTAFADPYLAPDGSIFFLGKLGVILKRTTDGNWELDVVDTNLDLTTMVQNERGDTVVGGVEGRVFVKQAGGEWQDLSLDPNYDVEHVVFHEDGRIDLIGLDSHRLAVFRADLGAPAPVWAEINAYQTSIGWTSTPLELNESRGGRPVVRPRQIVRSELHEVNGQYFIRVFSTGRLANPLFISASSKDFVYHRDTWKTATPSKKPEIFSVLPAGHVQIGVKAPGAWSWTGLPEYSRYVDSTRSWEEINAFVYRCNDEITTDRVCAARHKRDQAEAPDKDRFTFRSPPWFYSDTEALAIVTFTDRNVWAGTTDYDVRILKTENGGRTWFDSGLSRPSELCSRFVSELQDRLLMSCSNTGDFYESTDFGETWTHVRQHENF